MSQSEAEIQNSILLKYGREPDVTLWRNNTGQLREEWVTVEHLERLVALTSGVFTAQSVKEARELCSKLIMAPARYVRYGLCVGSSDIIGIVRVNDWSTREDGSHGPALGVMLAAEVKRPGKKPTTEQQLFIELVNSQGGIAGCVHSVDEFGALLQRARML